MSSLRKRVERDDLRDEQREKRKEAFDADVARIREQMQKEKTGEGYVELVRENPDGSAVFSLEFPPEVMVALTRLGLMTALRAAVDEAKYLDPNVEASDTSPERVDEKGKQRHEWVGLTEEEINEVLGGDIRDEPSGELLFIRAIEAKLKEKNT